MNNVPRGFIKVTVEADTIYLNKSAITAIGYCGRFKTVIKMGKEEYIINEPCEAFIKRFNEDE